jgi:hypothetical protein
MSTDLDEWKEYRDRAGKLAFAWRGPGNPFWPDSVRYHIILLLTETISGRDYYRVAPGAPLSKLRNDSDYKALNMLVDNFERRFKNQEPDVSARP